MKHIYKLIIVLVAILGFGSCNLDVTDPRSLPEDVAYETIEDCDNALNGIYRSMLNHVVSTPAGLDASTDDIRHTSWGDDYGVVNALFQWHPGSSGFTGSGGSSWSKYYAQIGRVNKLLEELDKPNKFSKAEDLKRADEIRGESYMFRAIAHFEILRLYGAKFKKATAGTDVGIPYVKKAYNFDVKERKNVKNNLDDIHRDLTLAKQMMKPRAVNPINYLSINALYAFETRVYLYEENYQEVIKSADKLTGYELATTANELVAIWENDVPLGEVIYMIGLTETDVSGQLSLAENMYLRDKDSKGKSKANYLPTADVLSLYSTNDKRLQVYFKMDQMNPGTSNGEDLWLVNKYPGNPALSKVDKVNQTKYFRYAEVLLNKIEATFYVDEAKSQMLLNNFRAKRINKHINQSMTGELLLKEIKKERRREFAFEGMRFHDLRRWNDGFERKEELYTPSNHSISVAGEDYHWVYPIPQSEMNANLLGKSYQNPGYIK